jgi:hypothetical protein
VRHRQLRARTLLTGMMLALDDRRPAHLTEVRAALTSLPEADQVRLGVTEDWHGRPCQLTYRQVEHACRLTARALSKNSPDGAPCDDLQAACDQLLEASIPAVHKNSSPALAADWTDVETWSRPPRHGSTERADPEAAWGHRNSNLPGPRGEMFFGYFPSAAVMVADEDGPAVPELARRITLAGCDHDPVRQLVTTLQRMAGDGIPLGDIIDDSGYAHRDAEAWAVPLRNTGAQLIQDLHPSDRGPRGTHDGAVIANGNLMGTWLRHRRGNPGLGALRGDRGACLPDPRLNSNGTRCLRADRRDLGDCGGGCDGDPYSRPWTRSIRGEPGAAGRRHGRFACDTPAGSGDPGAAAGMGGRGLSHPQEQTPHSDGSR